MNKILEFFKFLFAPRFKLGSLESPVDPRNIDISKIQSPVGLPDDYETELPPVENQGSKPICVGEAVHKIVELFYSEDVKNPINLSPDDLYKQCKLLDGIPNIDGTFPSVAAKVVVNSGVATEEAYNTGDRELIENSRKSYKMKGYAFVDPFFDVICQAIYQNKALSASFNVSSDWFRGKITAVLSYIGGHAVVLNGFKISTMTLKGQNSWGVGWIGYIAGMVNTRVKPGHFEMSWFDYKDNIRDIIAFTPIPPKILEEAKSKEYRFSTTMRFGSRGYEVQKLQERMNKELGISLKTDGMFGKNTQFSVISYQRSKGLVADGIVGFNTRAELNRQSVSLIPLWAKAIQNHEGYLPPSQYPPAGSRAYRNNNPANFKIGSQLSDYMKKLGGTGTDPQGFVIFPSYQVGFNALCTFLKDACTDKLNSYNSDMTLLEFFGKYAPGFENNTLVYARYVAKQVGIAIDTKIKELL